MRKPAFCICENKGADHLRINPAADQGLCFCYVESVIPLIPIFQAICGCTAWFVSDLVINPEDRFFVTRLISPGQVWLLTVKGKHTHSATTR